MTTDSPLLVNSVTPVTSQPTFWRLTSLFEMNDAVMKHMFAMNDDAREAWATKDAGAKKFLLRHGGGRVTFHAEDGNTADEANVATVTQDFVIPDEDDTAADDARPAAPAGEERRHTWYASGTTAGVCSLIGRRGTATPARSTASSWILVKECSWLFRTTRPDGGGHGDGSGGGL
jgi:hypothetical protein